MRGNQYAAASRFYCAVSGILGRPVKPGDDDRGYGARKATTEGLARVFKQPHCPENTPPRSRGTMRPSFAKRCRPKEIRGRREDRVLSSHPRPVCIGRKHTVVATGGAGSSGLPCAMVLTVTSCSPRGPGSLAPVTSADYVRESLAPASGRQDHTTSPSATSVARLAPPPRPPHPTPRS
jgi:hypothetical protein